MLGNFQCHADFGAFFHLASLALLGTTSYSFLLLLFLSSICGEREIGRWSKCRFNSDKHVLGVGLVVGGLGRDMGEVLRRSSGQETYFFLMQLLIAGVWFGQVMVAVVY